ncbi:hypothetical protein P154DRAFT_517176 [Amniculicola lignicola CBS 123094]|uniref:CENP-V/GFA domain-containing protein n=1 Tax=Amniculicola lignicola CBS 123094 TaxID=1392246 RepID=A0A6A5X3I4_9PLEO|nr:hypothetical protein P154DRAFT_517176 [Amniculicola lignicola CBS 123094]
MGIPAHDTSITTFEPLKGHCTCKHITYTVTAPPLVTHCCHCTWCQRETGTAFALNSVVESTLFELTSYASPLLIKTPSNSGNGQLIARCPRCYVTVYSHYPGAGKLMTFFRAGTLDDASRERVLPDVHIFAESKVSWVDLEGEKKRGVKVYDEYYEREEVWKADMVERRRKYLEEVEEGRRNSDYSLEIV